MRRFLQGARLRRDSRRSLLLVLLGWMSFSSAQATPYTPSSDAQVLAVLPAGARYNSAPNLELARSRIDVALPLTQFYIQRARSSGDLRFLGYAEATLSPWLAKSPVSSQVLVLHATILQSRHAFAAALAELDQALAQQPQDPQAWLTRATVLRVLGQYDEAMVSCQNLGSEVDPAVTTLCTQSILALNGHLRSAYAAIGALPQQAMSPEARAWRYSELGEMAERIGDDKAAEHWLREGLQLAPDDAYMRAACADVLLRQGRPEEAEHLLSGYESMEPLLLRLAIAQQRSADPASRKSATQLAGAFDLERQRGDAVHGRELARFLLDVDPDPTGALDAAIRNWQVQREPDDALVLLRAAQVAHQPSAAAPALEFLKSRALEDARVRELVGGDR